MINVSQYYIIYVDTNYNSSISVDGEVFLEDFHESQGLFEIFTIRHILYYFRVELHTIHNMRAVPQKLNLELVCRLTAKILSTNTVKDTWMWTMYFSTHRKGLKIGYKKIRFVIYKFCLET